MNERFISSWREVENWVNEGEDKDEKNGGGENGDASDCTIEAPELKYR